MTADVHAPQEILEAENAALRRRLAAAERQATHQSSTSSTDAHGHDAEFLRDVLASSNDCIKVLDLDGNLTFMSGGGQRVMEVGDFNAIRGCPWPDFWRGPGHADAKAAVESARAGGVGRFQGPAETMAGTPRFWDVQVTPIRGAGGHVERLLSISRDITATWLAETTLRDSEANLRLQREFLDAVIRQAPVGIAITEAGGGRPAHHQRQGGRAARPWCSWRGRPALRGIRGGPPGREPVRRLRLPHGEGTPPRRRRRTGGDAVLRRRRRTRPLGPAAARGKQQPHPRQVWLGRRGGHRVPGRGGGPEGRGSVAGQRGPLAGPVLMSAGRLPAGGRRAGRPGAGHGLAVRPREPGLDGVSWIVPGGDGGTYGSRGHPGDRGRLGRRDGQGGRHWRA